MPNATTPQTVAQVPLVGSAGPGPWDGVWPKIQVALRLLEQAAYERETG
jgi:hypothetical protein